jgi:hypothetical protein
MTEDTFIQIVNSLNDIHISISVCVGAFSFNTQARHLINFTCKQNRCSDTLHVALRILQRSLVYIVYSQLWPVL